LLLNGLFVVRFLPLIRYGVNGDGFLVTISIPVVPNGYEFFPVCIPMGTKSYPNPAPNRVFIRQVSGIGYPLTSLPTSWLNMHTNTFFPSTQGNKIIPRKFAIARTGGRVLPRPPFAPLVGSFAKATGAGRPPTDGTVKPMPYTTHIGWCLDSATYEQGVINFPLTQGIGSNPAHTYHLVGE
jgi:hypothetical protein